jgi:UDP-N-acetylmuramate dehydrogenase
MIKLNQDVSLAQRSTFRLGGSARQFTTARTSAQLAEAIRVASRLGLRLHTIGHGSNILVNDAPLDALVVAMRIHGLQSQRTENKALVRAGAGMGWDSFVMTAVHNGWQGIERLSGIPGTVGAAPIQNIGAYGQSVSDTLVSVEGVDTKTGEHQIFKSAQCRFGYRSSALQRSDLLVTSATFGLPFGNPKILQKARDETLATRGPKGALLMPAWPRMRSAGSFFKNPVVDKKTFEAIRPTIVDKGSGKWFWKQENNRVKLAAARLIESAGFSRGWHEGSVGLSPYHALMLVAYRGAKASDITDLARRIQEAVAKRFEIVLEPEVQLWGWRSYPLLRA